MFNAARSFQPANHPEFILMAVQPGEEHDSGLIKIRGRFENEPGQRNSGRENAVKLVWAARVQRLNGGRCGRRDGVKDSEQSIAMMLTVAADQDVIVEVVAGIHPNTRGQLSPHVDLTLGIEQRNFNAIQLASVIPY